MKKIITVFLCAILFFTYASLSTSALRVPPMDYLNTYEEYQKFINEADLPDNFVYYESLTMFGEFKGLTVIYEYSKPKCGDNVEYYMYDFSMAGVSIKDARYDNEGPRFTIYTETEHVDLNAPNCRIYSIKGDDLSYAYSSDGYNNFGYYEFEDVYYEYYSDRHLSHIYWYDDIQSYSLAVNCSIMSYDPTSLIGRLLNKQTAPEAVDFLLSRNYTAKPEDITPPNTADFSSIFGFLSLVSAGFFTIFAVKKSKKKVINEN